MRNRYSCPRVEDYIEWFRCNGQPPTNIRRQTLECINECSFCLVQSLSLLHRNTMVVLSSHVATTPPCTSTEAHSTTWEFGWKSTCLCVIGARRQALYAKHFIFLFTFGSGPFSSVCSPSIGVSLRVYGCVYVHPLPLAYKKLHVDNAMISFSFFSAVVVTIWFGCVWRVLQCFRTEHLVRCVVEFTYTMNGSARAFHFHLLKITMLEFRYVSVSLELFTKPDARCTDKYFQKHATTTRTLNLYSKTENLLFGQSWFTCGTQHDKSVAADDNKTNTTASDSLIIFCNN